MSVSRTEKSISVQDVLLLDDPEAPGKQILVLGVLGGTNVRLKLDLTVWDDHESYQVFGNSKRDWNVLSPEDDSSNESDV